MFQSKSQAVKTETCIGQDGRLFLAVGPTACGSSARYQLGRCLARRSSQMEGARQATHRGNQLGDMVRWMLDLPSMLASFPPISGSNLQLLGHFLVHECLVVHGTCGAHSSKHLLGMIGSNQSRDWRFHFSVGPTKSAVMVFGRGRMAIPPFHVGTHVLPRVYQYTYLEVTIDARLSWTHHFNELLRRGERKMAACLSCTRNVSVHMA